MINAILLRSRMTRNCHVRFWSRVRRGDPLGLDNRAFEFYREELENEVVTGNYFARAE